MPSCPAYRTQSMLDNFLLKGPGQAVNTASLYRMPFGQIFVRGISTAALGALQGMLNALLDYSKTRVTRAGGRSAENPSFSCCAPRRRRPDRRDDDHSASQFSQPARLCPARRDAAARGALAIQVPIDGGHRALHAASRRASSRRPERPGCRRTCRSPGYCGSHGGAAAHFEPVRIRRQQLGRRDVRSREQGLDGLADSCQRHGAAARRVARRMRCHAQFLSASFVLMAASTSAKALCKSSTSRFSCAHFSASCSALHRGAHSRAGAPAR